MFETVNTAFANVKCLLITLPAPDGDDQAKFSDTEFCFHVHFDLCTRIK